MKEKTIPASKAGKRLRAVKASIHEKLAGFTIWHAAVMLASVFAGARLGAVKTALRDKRGESSVGQAVAILIAVVIGALLLAGLYMLFSDTILPTLTQRIREMFDYNG